MTKPTHMTSDAMTAELRAVCGFWPRTDSDRPRLARVWASVTCWRCHALRARRMAGIPPARAAEHLA